MTDDYRADNEEEVDRAISGRLAKLRAMPVDTSAFDKKMLARIPSPQQRWRVRSFRPLRALAASVLLVSVITAAIMLTASSGPALAEPAQMAQVHQDIVAGRIPVMQVASIREANQMLNSQSPGAPTLPQMPDSHVMACCMKSVQNKKMACVLLKDEDVPITLAVASAADMKLAPAPVTTRNGVEYRVQKFGDLSMVMTEQHGQWLCLIGQVSADHLMDLAAQIRF